MIDFIDGIEHLAADFTVDSLRVGEVQNRITRGAQSHPCVFRR
jgi:hypothetical protein